MRSAWICTQRGFVSKKAGSVPAFLYYRYPSRELKAATGGKTAAAATAAS